MRKVKRIFYGFSYDEGMDMSKKSFRYLVYGIILMILEIIWGIVALGTELLNKSSKNIVYYVIAILIACISYAVYENVVPDDFYIKINEKWVSCFLFLMLGTVTAWIFIKPYIWGTVNGYFPQNTVTRVIQALLLIMAIAMAVLFYKSGQRENKNKKSILMMGLYAALIGISVWAFYRGNVFDGDLFHFDAYYHSIYKIYQLQPYSEINSGIYGFYGMLLLPFTRVMGVSYDKVIALLAILDGVTLACCFYVVDSLFSHTWIKVVTAVSLSSFVVWERTAIYCQMFPHRILFGGIILAYIVWGTKHKKNNSWYVAIGTILCILSIAWNVETGIAVTLAFVGGYIAALCRKWKIIQKTWWLHSLGALFIIPVSFLGAYGMVGAYNLLTGGQFLTIKTFLFPLVGSEQDFIDLLYVNLPVQLSPWMGCLAIILICTAYVMKRCFFENTADSQTEILTAAIILVAIQMVYYVNRASQNCLYIVIPVMGILMGWIAEKTGKSKDRIYRVLFSWIATVLLMMAIVFPVRLIVQQKSYVSQRNMEKIEQFAEQVKKAVPADTVGFGEGIDEIYSYLGWNTGYFGMDMPDILYSNQVCVDYIFNLIEESDSIFVNDDSLNTLSYYFGNNTWKEEYFLKNYTCTADLYYEEGSKYNYRLYIKNK